MKKLVLFPLMLLLAMTVTACDGDSPNMDNDDTEQSGNNSRMITIKVGDQTITATMEDNVAARDFLSRLPLEVTLNDYSNTEKIFYPSPALDVNGAPRGCTPAPGDITIYEPWSNVAIFYKSFSSSNSLIKIGHINDSGINALNVPGDVRVRFEQKVD
ncbi:MAG: cyclophilin-like fold protein [Dysgonomonas sp.]|nr:cyclophilin-like fold protein [Dysgonomonas sp.]